VLLATIFFSADGLALSPLIIVAYVAAARLTPAPDAPVDGPPAPARARPA
jgi:hypothetical protein